MTVTLTFAFSEPPIQRKMCLFSC